MTEDEIYRASTQFRLWNFTQEKLTAQRTRTNALAVEHVKAALKRRKATSQLSSANASATASEAEGNGTSNGTSNGAGTGKVDNEVECLTPGEEKKLVGFMCSNLLTMVDNYFKDMPINVTGTAVQFLKRFYLSHSPMDYHPRSILPTALFLATKTENYSIPLKDFAEKVQTIPGLQKFTIDTILAPEFILTQGLRFCFDVRHPYRALKAFFYQELGILKHIAKGGQSPPGFTTLSSTEIQKALLNGKPPQHFLASVDDSAYAAVKDILSKAALLSDAYFLYTPSQIHFGAWYIHNPSLLEYYLEIKLSASASASASSPMLQKLLSTIRSCATLLEEAQVQTQEDRAEMKRIDKKLYLCQNPDKKDLVGLNKAKKRDAGEGGKLGEGVAKKRKLQRENNEKEANELFGPDLVRLPASGSAG